jgi:hypothetical protein
MIKNGEKRKDKNMAHSKKWMSDFQISVLDIYRSRFKSFWE